MTVKGGTTPACAVCKYQRRKCSPTCPLAPYFPSSRPKMFQNVHRLFGVSNVTKILESLDTDDQKDDAMKSIIYESDMRQRFPVHGCSTIIHQLQCQLHCAMEELRYVYAQIAACKEKLSNRSGSNYWPSTHMDVGSGLQIQDGFNYPAFLNEHGPFHHDTYDNKNNVAAIQAQMNAFGIQQEERNDILFQDFEGMNDRKLVVESSTSESSTKTTTTTTTENYISKSDLRNAAVGLCITSTTR